MPTTTGKWPSALTFRWPSSWTEFERNRAATIAAVEAADERLFGQQIRSAGGVVGPLAEVFHQVAVAHVLGHARDISG